MPLPVSLYNKPAKSSADGGIKNLYLPLFCPLTLPLASEKVLKIMDFMDELDDVQEVHTNAEFPENFEVKE